MRPAAADSVEWRRTEEKTSLILHSAPAAPAVLAVLALALAPALAPAPAAAVWTTTMTRTTRAGRNDLGIH